MPLPEKNPVVLQSLGIMNETYFHQKNKKKKNIMSMCGAQKTFCIK